jgi:hypothetical protein
MTEAGETSLVVTVVVDGLPDKVFTSDPVTFFVPATATPTNTNTPEPTATSTNTPEPTATNTEVPTATATATLPALSGEMTITLINGPGPFTEGNPATFNICFFGVGAKTYTLDVAATNGEVSPVSSTIMTGGIGYGCAPTSFNLLGNVGDASITATLTLAGSAPFVQTSETITTIDSDGR